MKQFCRQQAETWLARIFPHLWCMDFDERQHMAAAGVSNQADVSPSSSLCSNWFHGIGVGNIAPLSSLLLAATGAGLALCRCQVLQAAA